MNKRGMELSITLLVLIIISIAIFISSLVLLNKINSGGKRIEQGINQDIEARLLTNMPGSGVVVIQENAKITKIGESVHFVYGIKNLLGAHEQFAYKADFSRAFDFQGAPILADGNYITEHWLAFNGQDGPFEIKNNEAVKKDILLVAQPQISNTEKTKKGTYFFNVCVFNASQTITKCDEALLGTPDALYPPGKIFKFSITID